MSTPKQIRFGAYLPTYHLPDEAPPTARFLASYAERAEALGFDSLWVIDHLFVSPPSYRVAFLEPLAALATAVAATRTVALGTGIIVLPLREPVLTAKALASLDALAEGRLIFGAGIGWDQQELDACQIDRATRGNRMDEMLDVIRGLWTEETFSYEGRHFVLRDVRLLPRPVRRPHPPIWLAAGSVPPGTSEHITQRAGYAPDRALRRVARVADGLMSAYRSVPDGDTTWLKRDRALLDQFAREAGRPPEAITHAMQEHMYIVMDGSPAAIESVVGRFTFKSLAEIAPYYLLGTPDDIVPKLQARVDAGIAEIVINFLDPDPRQLELFAKHVRPRMAA